MFQQLAEDGRNDVTAQAALDAADLIDEILTEGANSRWSAESAWRSLRAKRRVIDAYREDAQQAVMDAIARLGQTVSPPPHIQKYALRPRSAEELRVLRDWLRRVAEDLER